jgi:hypothetical protein
MNKMSYIRRSQNFWNTGLFGYANIGTWQTLSDEKQASQTGKYKFCAYHRRSFLQDFLAPQDNKSDLAMSHSDVA